MARWNVTYPRRCSWIRSTKSREEEGPEALGKLTGRVHLAFQAADRTMVDAFHRAAMAAGGTDFGAPGDRPYHPG